MSGRRVLNISEQLPSGLASEDDSAAQPGLEISPIVFFSVVMRWSRQQTTEGIRARTTQLLVRSTTAPKLSASPASADLWLA